MNLLNKKVWTSALALVLLLSGCTNTQETVNEDVSAPWIDVKQYLIETYEGKAVNLDIATAYDAQDGLCDVEQSGFVDWNKAGEYFVVYSASDTSGNKREVAITVKVLPPKEETVSTNKPEEEDISEKTCQKPNALNHDIPCDQVLNAEAIKYLKLYYGKGGQDVCENEATEDQECKVINTNDGSFWGYGLLQIEDTEKKDD